MDVAQIKLILVTLFLGALCLYLAFKKTKQKRQVEDTIRSLTASAPQGLVELQGFAWPVGTEVLPIPSGLEAVYYSFLLQKLVTTGYGKVFGALSKSDQQQLSSSTSA